MNKHKFFRTAVSVLGLSAVLLITGRLVSAQEIEIGKTSDPLNVKSGTVASNVFFNDTSLSGLSVQDACDLVEEAFSSLNETEFTVVSPADASLTCAADCAKLGITWDLSDAESTLLSCELTGNLVERYKKAKDLQASPVTIDTDLSINTEQANAFLSELNNSWSVSPVNATVTSRSGDLTVTPSVTGISYDFTDAVAKLREDVLAMNIGESRTYTITPEVISTEPGLTTERAEGFTVIGAYTTYYDEPHDEVTLNRETNLEVSAAGINGSIFAPGDTISALAMYGDVSLEGGYKEAGTYSNGEHVDQIGGGICQTTTTLYNAGLYAELEIVYRRNHSMLVSYVSPSRDAMVYAAGNSDFKMENNTSDYIILEAWVDKSANSVTVRIIGHEDHAADHSVEYESEVLEVTNPTPTRVIDSSKPIGINCERSDKYAANDILPAAKSRLWKVTTDGDTVTRTLQNTGDTYKASTSKVYTAADTYCTFTAIYNESTQRIEVTVHPYFLNGDSLDSNVASWSSSAQDTFNSEMSKLMRQAGYTWPSSTKETTTAATTTEKETTTTAATTAEKETTTTAAPTTTTTAATTAATTTTTTEETTASE